MLEVTNLTSITGANNGPYALGLYALDGGRLNLSGVTNIIGSVPGASTGNTVSAPES